MTYEFAFNEAKTLYKVFHKRMLENEKMKKHELVLLIHEVPDVSQISKLVFITWVIEIFANDYDSDLLPPHEIFQHPEFN